jgi:hypothetical protein
MLIIAGLLDSYSHFMEPEAPFPCQQDPATGLYPELAESFSNSFFLNRNALSCQLHLGVQSDFIVSPLNTKTCRRFRSVTCVLHVLTLPSWFSQFSIISASAQIMQSFILMRRVSDYMVCEHSWAVGKTWSSFLQFWRDVNYSQWRCKMLQNLKQNARHNLNNIWKRNFSQTYYDIIYWNKW